MAKLRPTKATHIRVISHTAGPRRQIRAGQVLQVGAGITRDEATRLLAAGMADDASGELVGQDLGLLTAQLKALPEGQLAALLSALGARGSATASTDPEAED